MFTPSDQPVDDPLAADQLQPGEGVVLSVSRNAIGERHATLRPSRVESATQEQHEWMHRMQEAALDVREAQKDLARCVFHARESGLSWGIVGWYIGTSAEAARQRFSPDARPAGSRSRRRK